MFRCGLDKMRDIRYSDIIVELPGKVWCWLWINNSQVFKSTQYEINIISFRLDMYKELVTVFMYHMYNVGKIQHAW